MAVVVMGVSGSGKTTVARGVASALGVAMVDADDLHPPSDVAKMAAGQPLTDADRRPWLDLVADTLRTHDAGEEVVVACSALRRAHRDVLRPGARGVTFVLLDVPRAELEKRVA